MRKPAAENRSAKLCSNDQRQAPCRQLPLKDTHRRNDRVEVRKTVHSADLDQDEKAEDRRQGVGEQRQPEITVGQRLGHDPGADHDRHQCTGAEGLAEQDPGRWSR